MAHAASAAAVRLGHGGVDVAGYTVAEVLADVDDARVALGHDRIDLLSESYGTRLALLDAQAHSEHVARSVLLGVNPPGRFVWDPAIVDAQLADWGTLWAASGDGDRHPDFARTMSRALERLPRRWLGARINPDKARIVTFVLLFQPRNGLMAIDAWEAAAHGDPSGVVMLSLAYDVFVPRAFAWGDFLAKAFSFDYDADRDDRRWLDPPDAVLGSPLSLLFFAGGPSWPATTVADELRHLRTCEVESLLVSGALDISTPPQTARREALPLLKRGARSGAQRVARRRPVGIAARSHPDAGHALLRHRRHRRPLRPRRAATVPADAVAGRRQGDRGRRRRRCARDHAGHARTTLRPASDSRRDVDPDELVQ